MSRIADNVSLMVLGAQICISVFNSYGACRYISDINLLKPNGYVMHQLFNIKQSYVLPTLYLCVLYLSENKQRLVPLTS